MLVVYREGTCRSIASILIYCIISEVFGVVVTRFVGTERKASGQVVWVCPFAIDRLGPARSGERRAQRKYISRRKGI